MMYASLDVIRRHLTFFDRTSRSEFWLAHIVLLPMLLFTLLIVGTYVGGRSIWPSVPLLLLVVPWAALVVRRLHDMDRTGWWALVSLIPSFLVPPLGVPLGLIVVLAFGAPRGTPGPNRYGPGTLGVVPSLPEAEAARPHDTLQPAAGPTGDPADLITDLERLSTLLANGTLTAAEFEAMKTKAFGRGKAAQ